MSQIFQAKPPIIGANVGVWAPRRLVQDLVIPCRFKDAASCHRSHHGIHSHMESVIAVTVMLNMVLLMLYHVNMSSEYGAVLDTVNNAFLCVFGLEMVLKLFALGFRRYWGDKSNAFDGAIVVGSVLIEVLSQLSFFGTKGATAITQVRPRVSLCAFLRLCSCVLVGVLVCASEHASGCVLE